MSPITKEFTKEQLQQIIETDHVQCGEASALARIALASLEAEPVAWLLSGGGAKNNVSFDSGNAYADPLREVTPLYTAPPAPVALTSGYSDFEEIWSSSTHPLTQDDEMKDFAWDIWNACRAAMLQGAEPVTTAYKLPANTPCKDAPEYIWLQTAGVWPENGEFSELTWCSDNQHPDDTLYVRADVVGGNSQVIPDWQTQAEKMAELYGSSFVLFRNGESPQCAEPTKVIISFTDDGLGHGSAAPQQEA
ncbi:TPA: DUF551 domain-containing protein [Enterobacter roggenkampii]